MIDQVLQSLHVESQPVLSRSNNQCTDGIPLSRRTSGTLTFPGSPGQTRCSNRWLQSRAYLSLLPQRWPHLPLRLTHQGRGFVFHSTGASRAVGHKGPTLQMEMNKPSRPHLPIIRIHISTSVRDAGLGPHTMLRRQDHMVHSVREVGNKRRL